MIYAIQAGDSGPIKIGLTRNNPRSRLAELQTGNPEPLRLLVAVNIEDRCERHIHKWLSQERMKGEWFKPSEKTLSIVEDLQIRASLGDGDQTEPDADSYGLEYFRRHPEATGLGRFMETYRAG